MEGFRGVSELAQARFPCNVHDWARIRKLTSLLNHALALSIKVGRNGSLRSQVEDLVIVGQTHQWKEVFIHRILAQSQFRGKDSTGRLDVTYMRTL